MKNTITKILTLAFALLLTVSVCACGEDKPKDIEDMTDSELASALSSALGGGNGTADNSSKETESKEPEKEHKYEDGSLKFSYDTNEPTEDSEPSGNDGTIMGYPVSNYNGEIIYYYKNSIGRDLCVLSYADDGSIYVNSYLQDGSKDDFDNKVVGLYANKTNYTTAKNVTVVEADGVATLAAEIDGKYYTGKVSGLNYRNPQIYVYELEGATKLFASGTDVYASSAIYSKGDGEACLYMSGTKTHTLTLPNGYTAKDVKEAYLEKLLVVVMNDGTVCTIETEKNGGDYTYTVNEELTKLNKEGHIKEFRFSSYSQGCTGLVLMDDGKVYSYDEVTYR